MCAAAEARCSESPQRSEPGEHNSHRTHGRAGTCFKYTELCQCACIHVSCPRKIAKCNQTAYLVCAWETCFVCPVYLWMYLNILLDEKEAHCLQRNNSFLLAVFKSVYSLTDVFFQSESLVSCSMRGIGLCGSEPPSYKIVFGTTVFYESATNGTGR